MFKVDPTQHKSPLFSIFLLLLLFFSLHIPFLYYYCSEGGGILFKLPAFSFNVFIPNFLEYTRAVARGGDQEGGFKGYRGNYPRRET